MAAIEVEIISSPGFLPPTNSELTTKQHLFVQYYLETRNATKSAELAGYQGNAITLGAVGKENLQKPLIREAIETAYKSRHLSADGVLAELSDIASAPWKDFVEVKYGDNGEVLPAVVKLTDKIKAAELIGKFHKLFADKAESEVSLSDQDVTRIGDQLVSSLMEAASRRRLGAARHNPTDAAPESV